jgi:SP family galactose:H+ symporter-like MFS transporter
MKNFFIVIVAMVSGISGMLFGYDTGVISGAILFIKQAYPLLVLLPFLQELVISAVLIGAIIGAIIGGSLADRYGRRKMIIIAAIIFAGGAIGTSLTPNYLLL